MRRLSIAIAMLAASACGGGSSAEPADGSGGSGGASSAGGESGGDAGGGTTAAASDEFQLRDSDDAGQAHGEHESQIEASRTHAAMRLFVVDPEQGPITGIVIKLIAPDGTPYYTGETDSVGYAEVLVPVGQRYRIEYLSLGRRTTSANVEDPPGPNQDIRLTMRYRRQRPAPRPAPAPGAPEPPPEAFVLEGILFETGSATIMQDSLPRLAGVVEYMTHHPSTRIRIAGHTDNVGNPQRNQALSEQRAQSVRTYLVSQGIDGGRVEAVGLGDTQPVASNDTEEGRAQNRRIEAIEL